MTPNDEATDNAAQWLMYFEPPDFDDNTGFDVPRPPLVSRFMVYRAENVRVMFLARGTVGAPPPYKWRFIAFSDAQTNQPLDVSDAMNKLYRKRR
jgi:hypothetical protein